MIRLARPALSAVLLLSGALPTLAATPNAIVGKPASLLVQPAPITLAGPRALQQVIVTGSYADHSIRDLSQFSTFAVEDAAIAAVDAAGIVTPHHNGKTALVVRAGGLATRVPVTVTDVDKLQPVSFRREVIAALNVGGCNAGACHGTPSGKNGFRLSLRGFDPAADYLQLTHDAFSRRTDRQHPEDSLILLKALGRIPHEGGVRYPAQSLAAGALCGWLAEGLHDDPPGAALLQSIEILPGPRVQREPARWQQLLVLAHLSDGSTRDVTRLTVFSSSDTSVAEVDRHGLVEFHQAGEVAVLCRYLMELSTVRLGYLQPRPGLVWVGPLENNYVDHHVFAKLKVLGIPPSDLCSDAEFVRRAYLDLCGILPTPAEVQQFLSDQATGKRSHLIEELLERPEYADFWTLKWSDVLRASRKMIRLKGVFVFQQWLHEHVAQNTPLDEVVREILTASGSTFANPPANYFRTARDPQNLAETTMQLFCGIRMQCARCHNHPFERWTQDDYYSTAAFFARVRRKSDNREPGPNPLTPGGEIIYSDRAGEVVQPRSGRVMPPKFMGGPVANVPPHTDRRVALAEWLTAPSNPFFARAAVNRIWFHLMGRGIVDPVDDFRDSNPPANDALLDALARDFVDHHFDIKQLIRTIMNSRTYQLSAATNEFNKEDNKYFSHATTKLLTAEQLLDALCTVTERPEKFPGLPAGTRATQLPDGEVNHPFLKAFGQPARELACECERESESNLGQALQLMNGPTVNEKLRSPGNRLGRLLAKRTSDLDMLNELYLATLSRLPTPADIQAALGHVARTPDRRKGWEDVQWALLNAKEFLFRH